MEAIDFASFSHPDHDAALRRSLLERLLVQDAQAHTSRFLSRTAAQLDATTTALASTLSQWATEPGTLAQARGYPVALAVFQHAALDPAWVAAMAALHLHAAGFDGEWRATFAQPRRLRWGGLVTPPVLSATVSVAAGKARLALVARDGSRSVSHVPAAGGKPLKGWLPLHSSGLGKCPPIVLGRETAAALPTVVARDEYSLQSNRKVAEALGLAGALLRQYAPGFLAWVTDADWAVAAIRDPGDNRCTSFSSRGMLGVPFISFPLGPMLVAELLVHETSHNYYHCAQLHADPCNDKDTALYPSPYVQTHRPIDRILIAFHAFANIVLLYRTMLAAGLDEQRDAAEAAIAGHLPILTRFSEVLTQSPGLTEVGRAIFEPLRARLFA